MKKLKNMFSGGGGSNDNNTSKGSGLGGIWSWNNNGNWQPFDAAASKQIDNELRNQWNNSNAHTICFPITKGPWFSKNIGTYFCNIQLNSSRTKIKGATQQNTKTGFARQMMRNPSFMLHPHQNNKNNKNNHNKSHHNSHHNSSHHGGGKGGHKSHHKKSHHSNNNNNYNNNSKGQNYQYHAQNFGANTTTTVTITGGGGGGNISYNGNYGMPSMNNNTLNTFGTMNNGPMINNDGSVCWSWQDDYQWKPYDSVTIQQIESEYAANKNSVVLTKGPYFGASHRMGVYMIKFDKNSMPPSFTQINTQTHFQRKVARTGGVSVGNKNINNSNQDQDGKKDKHSKWRPFYRPMTITHFKTLKDKEKLCSICFCEFEEKDLFENQCKEFKQWIQSKQSNKNNDNNNFKKKKVKLDNDSDGDSVMIDDETTNNSNNNNKNDEEKKEAPSKTNVFNFKIPTDIANKISDDTMVHLSKCVNNDHYFHSECIARWLNEKGKCCHCQMRYAIETGNQPTTGRLNWSFLNYPCSGFESYGTIKISFEFDGGIQGKEHYHPGQHYQGDHREAYLPNNEAGREALELTKIAWKRRLIFSIGTSLTTKRENRIVWASIHFKTRLDGGQQSHGFPDDTYFDRFKEELKAKGVTVDDLDDSAKNNIKNGYQNYGSY